MKHNLQGWHYLESFEINGEETPHEVGADAVPDTFVHCLFPGEYGFKNLLNDTRKEVYGRE